MFNLINYLGASPLGTKKANAQDESRTDTRTGVLNPKENKLINETEKSS